MDVDMDVPLPDELEWLEANSHLDEGYDDVFYPEEEEIYQEEQQPEPPQLLAEPNNQQRQQAIHVEQLTGPGRPVFIPPSTDLSSQKRPRLDEAESSSHAGSSPLEEKRARIASPEIDEDHLDNFHRQELPVEEKFLSRYASEIDGDCIPITSPDGDRVYAKICGMDSSYSSKKLDIRSNYKGLIKESVDYLLQKAEQDAFLKALHVSSEGLGDAMLPRIPCIGDQLWVDKYAPNSFTELLSDEQTNREVLMWLKQWDSSVFGSEIRSTSDDVMSALKRKSSFTHHQKLSETGFIRSNGVSRSSIGTFRQLQTSHHENGDPKGIMDLWNKMPKNFGPPAQKILLLCGPPGFGKTTLAHVAARHCGYRVVEINASDDRSSSAIESKILDVVQMNSINDDLKPKCLVIDEIDGSLGDGKGAVEVLLRMLSAEKPSNEKENGIEGHHLKRSSKRRSGTTLSRPVICICNDLYAPALRQLRHVTKVHIFVQPTLNRIVSRLKHICNKEGFRISSVALTALADYTECDIRCCLNTLQFVKNKKDSPNALDINSQVIGRKDLSRSLFDVWKEIFHKKKVKRKGYSGDNNISSSTAFEYLDALISRCGDYDLMLDGIHENILRLHYNDPLLRKTVKCLDNVGISDTVHGYVMRTQRMSLNVYLPSIAITINRLVAQIEKPTIQWPKAFYRFRTLFMEKVETLKSWRARIMPDLHRHISVKSFVEDSVSQLLHVLSPPTLRPVAIHLLSESEKTDFDQLVSTMVFYSITYKNQKSNIFLETNTNEASLEAVLCFDPPVAEFIGFKGHQSCHHILPLAVRQVLVHEVEKQRIIQKNVARCRGSVSESQNRSQSTCGTVSGTSECAFNGKSQGRNQKECLLSTASERFPSKKGVITDASNLAAHVKRNLNSSSFFDRFRKPNSKSLHGVEASIKSQSVPDADLRPLLFKFNEGFTNAVKRPVRMREFLL